MITLTLPEKIARLKPGVPVRTHLLASGLIWSLVGLFLMVFGSYLLALPDHALVAVAALLLGSLKSRKILDRVAARNIDRILGMPDGTCIGAVYPLKMWGLVILMMVLGRLLRASALPAVFIGALYLGIGWALFFSSRLMWRRWRRH
jgi:hypothetical protein